ncbi:YkvA family protein [Modestobacter sp. URMC 112]
MDALRAALPVLGAVAGSLLVLWLLLLVLLWLRRPDDLTVREALRLLPDVLRLVRRLAADRDLPLALRLRVWLLLAYLLSPLDLVPDVLPVVGYADDAVLVAWVLRSVVRRAGDAALARHWPGTDGGLAVVRRLAGLPTR